MPFLKQHLAKNKLSAHPKAMSGSRLEVSALSCRYSGSDMAPACQLKCAVHCTPHS